MADRTLAQTRDSVRAAAATALAGGVAASAVLGPRAASSAGPAFHAALFG
jgi:hypothetical protein